MPEEPNAAPAVAQGAFSALRHREFAWFWSAAIVSNTGTWMQTIAVPFVIDELTHSTALVGLAVFVQFFPLLVLGPVAGSLADRCSRRSVLLWTQALMMAATLALWLAWITDVATPGVVLALVLVSGIGNGLTVASWQAFVPQLVPRESMLNALRLNSAQYSVARVLGPAIAGLVLATLGAGLTFLVNALSFGVVLVALAAIRPRPPAMSGEHGGVLAHFREALGYVRRRAGLSHPLVTLTAYAFLGAATIQLAEAINRRLFHAGPGRYGLLVGAYGVGGLLASAFVLSRADRFRRSRMAIAGFTLYAVAELALGAAPRYGIGVAAVFFMGMAHTLGVVAINTSVHTTVDEEHRGRVASMSVLAIGAGVPIGALAQGLVAEHVGLRPTVVVMGVLLALYVAFAVTRFEGLRAMDGA